MMGRRTFLYGQPLGGVYPQFHSMPSQKIVQYTNTLTHDMVRRFIAWRRELQSNS